MPISTPLPRPRWAWSPALAVLLAALLAVSLAGCGGGADEPAPQAVAVVPPPPGEATPAQPLPVPVEPVAPAAPVVPVVPAAPVAPVDTPAAVDVVVPPPPERPAEPAAPPVPPVPPVPADAVPEPEPVPEPVVPAAPAVPPEPEGPGRLLAATPLERFAAEDVTRLLATGATRVPSMAARYAVQAYRLEYLTVDADGRTVRASALLAVPLKGEGATSPLLSYQHATIFRDAEAPSNDLRPDAPPVVMAALGYVVLAADYVGYGVSRGAGHPYLLSAPSAAAVTDLLTAARSWRQRNGVATNGQLFLAGYSEGGYVTMAALRALESSASPHRGELVLAVPGAGPYDLTSTLDGLLERVKRERSAFIAALIDPGFLRHLPGAVRVEVRRALVRALLPDDADVSFDTRFVDAFIEDDRDKIERQSNVHDWRPAHPVNLFHGRDDRTVPYVSSVRTLAAMQARAAPAVGLVDCPALPADHLECVTDYWIYMVGVLAAQARDL